MTTFLAIDGGNSKTDVVLGRGTGEILAGARGPGTCHSTFGLATSLARLDALVSEVFAAAAVDHVDQASIFLAGADLPDEIELLTGEFVARRWADTVHVENDTWALLWAGTDASDAVAVVCGAGINCVGRTADGRTTGFPSIGPVSGDWGGGGHLGRLALWHGVRAEDGRGPATALAGAVAAHFGRESASEVGVHVHIGAIAESDLADLAPAVFTTAADGDTVALSLVERLVEEIVTLATVTARRLELTEFAVVLGGGVLRARHPLLVPPIVEGILAAYPKADVSVVDAPPVDGAIRHALTALAPLYSR
jgi:N-acetylglucosamine kinase-like BadF-type ATPase